MKVGTHIKILINSLATLSGLIFYFVIARFYLFALILGIATAIYGNFYGSYIAKRMKKELPEILISLFVSKREEEKTLNIIEEMSKHGSQNPKKEK